MTVVLEAARCAGKAALNGKRCHMMGRPPEDGADFLCRHHRPLADGVQPGELAVEAAAALLAQRRAQKELDERRRREADEAARAAYLTAAARSNRGGGAHGPRRQGLVDKDSGGDR